MKRTPFLLTPSYKDYIWGGNRLNDDYSFNAPVDPFAEAWVCSTHSEGEAFVGEIPLSELLAKHPEYLGTHPLTITNGQPILPIIIKLIDAKDDLSIQVHPDDEYARKHGKEFGKTEMWYVLDAKPTSKIVYGFKSDVTPQEVRESIKDGSILNKLNYVPVKKDDLFYIEAGMVHAIGAGSLVAEIQENSNITYRLYDYDRKSKDGIKRLLHIDEALKVANLHSSIKPRQPLRVLRYRNGCASELLTRCKYFQVERFLLNTETHRNLIDFKAEKNSFHALLCINGCGSILLNNGEIVFFKGDCIFVPADSVVLKFHGKAQLLNVSC